MDLQKRAIEQKGKDKQNQGNMNFKNKLHFTILLLYYNIILYGIIL